MSKESDFLLGAAFAMVTQCRSYFIMHDDKNGVAMIEDEYQRLTAMIDAYYYNGQSMERKDD